MDWYLLAWRRYSDFAGRSRRSEYWYFFLGNLILGIVLAVVDFLLAGSILGSVTRLIDLLYSLAVLVPGIAVTIRRLHDTGRPGIWILIGFVPVVGVIVLFLFTTADSQPGSNQYGASPKARAR
jgi:uncharacterized membrane protein YhaH (DUF805 family)